MDDVRVEEKAYAYVVRDDGRLLVFDHPDAAAGTQVPKGGVEADESPREAVVRELMEESGLTAIEVDALLAEDRWPHPEKPKAYRRYFFRVTPTNGIRDAWTHEVTGAGEDEGMAYAYRWADPASISLTADMDDYVDRL
jgi:8-oxo-dGTP pyrophosphatase MutT (NUDIX family)